MTKETIKQAYQGCYLTIDDGPDESFIDKLTWLDDRGIKAIWYCQGNHLHQYEEAVIEAIKNGHVIGNHSYDHPNFGKLTYEEAVKQVEQTQSMIDDLYIKAGVKNPPKTFRYPYLAPASQTFSRYLYGQGYRHPVFIGLVPKVHDHDLYLSSSSVGSNFDTEDWRIINEDESFDQDMCLEGLKEKMIQWSIEQAERNEAERTYTLVLCHCFTSTFFFKKMVLLMLEGGMVFNLPKSSLASHLLPIARQDEHHETKHNFIMNHKDRDTADLILLGDSITRRWEDNEPIFKGYFGHYTSINMGVGGDTINNLLWRIEAGELDEIKAKYMSLLIGTNSLPYYPDAYVIEGIKEDVTRIRKKCPDTRLIYNHIFPRNPDKDCSDYVSRIQNINLVMKEWLPKDIMQLSMMEAFLEGNQRVSQKIMPDGLHIDEVGYHMWGKKIQAILEN